jgi:hypothetical protein
MLGDPVRLELVVNGWPASGRKVRGVRATLIRLIRPCRIAIGFLPAFGPADLAMRTRLTVVMHHSGFPVRYIVGRPRCDAMSDDVGGFRNPRG